MNLRTRVAMAAGLVVIGAVALVGAVEYPAIEAGMRGNIDPSLVRTAAQAPENFRAILMKLAMARGIAENTKGGIVVASGIGQEPTTFTVGANLVQIVPEPRPGSTGKFADLSPQDVQVAAGTARPYFADVHYDGVRYRVYTAPIAGFPGTLVRAAVPESDPTGTLHRLAWLLTLLIPAAGLLAVVAGRLLAARVLSPVGSLTAAAERIAATGDLGTPIEVHGRDEVARLGLAFNAMTAALDGSVGAQRRLVADASHELRTPLTSLITNLELLAENAADPASPALVADALGQARELKVLTNDLVDLARFGEKSTRIEVVRLDRVAQNVAERRSAASASTAVADPTEPTATTSEPIAVSAEPIVVSGDPDALERAIGNLVDNALKFAGAAQIAVARRGGVAVVEVSDTGPGVPAADLPYIFDRFHRSPAARSLPGSGLGLAIVKQIVEAHGGSVEAVPQPVGARFRITLPNVPDDAPDPAAAAP